jgi:prepilin-type N-terminal cleavage/methylation domain-containing protein
MTLATGRRRHEERRTTVLPAGRNDFGFTLVEVLLTMTLLVILAAVFWSNLTTVEGSGRLEQVADDLRGLFVGLRVRAIEEGQTYQFTFQPGSTTFHVSTLTGTVAPIAESQSASTRTSRVDFDSQNRIGQHELHRTLHFASTSGSAASDAADSAAGSTVAFFPDGSMTDAVVTVADQGGLAISITIRGLAGSVRMGPVERQPNLAAGVGGQSP